MLRLTANKSKITSLFRKRADKMNFTALLSKMVLFIILLLIGYFASRRGFLSRDFARSASWLLLNVFLVASILNSVLGERPPLAGGELWMVLLFMTLLMVLCYVIGAICARFDRDSTSVQTFLLIAVMNNLYVGMPVAQALCGNEAVFYFGLSCIPFNILLYTWGMWALRRGKGEKGIRLKEMISAPLISALLSLLIFITDIRVPKLVSDLLGSVSAATIPISMLVIGATLGSVRLSEAFSKKKLYMINLVRLIISPLLIWVLFRPFISNQTLLICAVVIAACPSGVLSTPLSIQFGYDPEYPSECIMLSTALSMVTLPALIWILFS